MLPIVLSPRSVQIGVVGQGGAVEGRLQLLSEAGISPAKNFENCDPEPSQLAGLNILFVAGLDESRSRDIYALARRAGVLVNVEDVPKLCDFHVPAQVRRGDLLITVSTGGRSPGLAARIRESLSDMFGREWEAHVDEIAVARARWRASGMSPGEVAERTSEMIDQKGWLAE